ncbi:hypothetical protein EZV62_006492 [Acer yangbiense]|uniref:Uncharacterized protein n=1 Tax=Acer yangbiense TaxID=1000413 RepID=A0A5C7I7T9_9ROSI|nr:hypothetical protein EZV62_006492 [Acer yangbiense]
MASANEYGETDEWPRQFYRGHSSVLLRFSLSCLSLPLSRQSPLRSVVIAVARNRSRKVLVAVPLLSTPWKLCLHRCCGEERSVLPVVVPGIPITGELRLYTMASHNFDMSKILIVSDITSEHALPTEMVKHMIPFMNGRHFLDLKAADIWGKEWPLCYYTRPNGSKICPVFTTGWHQYVEAKGVRVGDELIFSGHQVAAADGELPEMQYMIRVTRPSLVTFNGEPVPLDVEYLA